MLCNLVAKEFIGPLLLIDSISQMSVHQLPLFLDNFCVTTKIPPFNTKNRHKNDTDSLMRRLNQYQDFSYDDFEIQVQKLFQRG